MKVALIRLWSYAFFMFRINNYLRMAKINNNTDNDPKTKLTTVIRVLINEAASIPKDLANGFSPAADVCETNTNTRTIKRINAPPKQPKHPPINFLGLGGFRVVVPGRICPGWSCWPGWPITGCPGIPGRSC